MSIAERVAAGAAFLDDHDPGWWRPDVDRAIDLGTLDLGEPDRCILGQRCPLEVLNDYAKKPVPDDRYWAYAQALMLAVNAEEDVLTWAHDRGFADLGFLAFSPALTSEWERVIGQRRAEA